MLDQIDKIKAEVLSFSSNSAKAADEFRLRYLSKKGVISEMFGTFKSLPADQTLE